MKRIGDAEAWPDSEQKKARRMAIELMHADFHFDPAKGGERFGVKTVKFSRPVKKFFVALQSYNVSFADGDHHLGRLSINLRVAQLNEFDDQAVDVIVRFLLQDFSGNIDDRYQGDIGVNVIADVG